MYPTSNVETVFEKSDNTIVLRPIGPVKNRASNDIVKEYNETMIDVPLVMKKVPVPKPSYYDEY